MLQPKGDLACAQLAFFGLTLIVSVVILIRHGISKKQGWYYLFALAALRIIGASCTLYVDVNNDSSDTSLVECAFITSAVGTAPLLLVLMGMLHRVNAGLAPRGLSDRLFHGIHLVALAALVLAIIGGVEESSSTSSKVQSGEHLAEVAAILFLVIYLALAGITLFDTKNSQWVLPDEKLMVRAGLVALPFLLVRMAYTVAVAFANVGSDFYRADVNVYAEAFMQFLMEAIVVCLFSAAGLIVPNQGKGMATGNARDVEAVNMKSNGRGR